MKYILAIITVAFVAISRADMCSNTITGAVCQYPPAYDSHTFNPNYGYFKDRGWVMFTTQQQADWDSAQIAIANSNAAAADAVKDIAPATFGPRMDGTNILGQSQLYFDSDNNAYGVSDTGSPKHTAEEKRASRAAHEAAKAAKKAAKNAVLSADAPSNVKGMWSIFTNYVANQ